MNDGDRRVGAAEPAAARAAKLAQHIIDGRVRPCEFSKNAGKLYMGCITEEQARTILMR